MHRSGFLCFCIYLNRAGTSWIGILPHWHFILLWLLLLPLVLLLLLLLRLLHCHDLPGWRDHLPHRRRLSRQRGRR